MPHVISLAPSGLVISAQRALSVRQTITRAKINAGLCASQGKYWVIPYGQTNGKAKKPHEKTSPCVEVAVREGAPLLEAPTPEEAAINHSLFFSLHAGFSTKTHIRRCGQNIFTNFMTL